MSGMEILIDEIDGRLHAAVVAKGKLHDLYVDTKHMGESWSSLYLGKVVKIDKRLDAAFVDLGNGLTGFLPAKHVHQPGGYSSEARSGIAEKLKTGDMLLVQVKAEAKKASQHENHKVPRLTTRIYIIGHHLVYCPLASQVTMSRQIERPEVLAIGERINAKGGWILQEHAVDAEPDVLEIEARQLAAFWQKILGAKDASDGRPRLLKSGINAIYRVMSDYGAEGIDHIYCGTKKVFDMMTQWCATFDPPLAGSKRLRLFKPERTAQKLFDMYDVSSDIETLGYPTVHLEGGGSLIIEHTHALTTIDVNQGSATNAIETNDEAALEAARQVRLRNLNGAILIDFIGMEERWRVQKLLDTLTDAFKGDPAQPQVHGFTRLGIAEVTRKRRTGTYIERVSG